MSPEERDNAIGRQIQELRKARGMSQKDLLQALALRGINWSQTTLSQVEGGGRSLRFNEAPDMASALDAKLTDLLPSDDRMAAHLERARWSEAAASEQFADARLRYEGARRYRQSVQLVNDLAGGSKKPYHVDCSVAAFLRTWLSEPTFDLQVEVSTVLKALKIDSERISTAEYQAQVDAERWRDSGDPLSSLDGVLSPDNFPPYGGLFETDSDDDFLVAAVRSCLTYQHLGRYIQADYPNVIWEPKLMNHPLEAHIEGLQDSDFDATGAGAEES